jgi:hypothetical protein
LVVKNQLQHLALNQGMQRKRRFKWVSSSGCRSPTTSNFFVDFFVLVWYFSAIVALLSKRVLIPDSIRVRAESRYFLFQASTKGGTISGKNRSPGW